MAAIAVGGCASVRQSIGGWFGETPPPGATAASQGQPSHAAGERLTYYAAVEGLTVYSEPSESSKVVGHLALHERVTRSRLERGYAYVTGDKSRLEGWVDNGQLLWRIPASGAVEKAEPTNTGSPPAAEPTPTTTPETQAPPTLAPTPSPTRTVAVPKQYEPF